MTKLYSIHCQEFHHSNTNRRLAMNVAGSQTHCLFKKIKHPAIECFVKKCPFWIFVLKLIKRFQKQLPIRGIQPPPALLDYPSGLSFYWNKMTFSKNNFISFLIPNEVYGKKSEFDRENESNRNEYNALRRSLLWNTKFGIKLLKIKTSIFPDFPWVHFF